MNPEEYSNDTEYEIKSSASGITDILLNHYDVNLQSLSDCEGLSLPKQLKMKDKDVASVVAYVLINSEQGESDSNDADIYSVCDDYDQYQALKVGKDHVVVFSELKKRSILDAIWFLVKYGLLTKWNPKDPISNLKTFGPMVMEVIHYLQKAIKKLDISEECVFARIYELHRGGKKIFSASDIQCCSVRESLYGDIYKEQFCDYQTEGCCFRTGENNDKCKIDSETIGAVMKSLSSKGILESIGKGSSERWILVP